MKFKKIMLITFVLLAILTIGAVSASDDFISDGNLAISDGSNAVGALDEMSQDEVDNVGYDGNDIYLNEDEITQENFNYWASSHECGENTESWIVNVHGDDNVGEGVIVLNVSNSDVFKSYEKGFDEADENNDIYWTLEDLDIIDEFGTYTFNVSYINGDTQFDLINDFNFTLTQFSYSTYEGDIYINYPFDVIVAWNDEIDYVEVYVGENQLSNGGDNPLRWTLSDLEIDEVGQYDITIKAYKDDDLADEFTFNLNVDDDASYFRLISNGLGVQSWNLDDPVLYLLSPDDMVGKNVTFSINDDEFDLEITDSLMSWTLEDLGIEENEGFEIKIIFDDEEVANTYFDVYGIKKLSIDVWDEEWALYTDTEGNVISIRVPEDMYGMLDVIVSNTVKYHTIITSKYHDFDDGFDTYDWDLKSLGITQAGDYNVTLKFVSDGDETVMEYLFNVRDFDNSTFRSKVIAYDEPFYLYLFTPAGETGTVVLTFKGWDDEEEEEFIDCEQTLELNESYWNKWVMISDYMNYDCNSVNININGEEISTEYAYLGDGGNFFTVTDRELNSPEDIAIWVYANTTDNNYTFSITSGDYTFIKNVTELGDYEWINGNYKYFITLEDLDSFDSLNDKDMLVAFYDIGNGGSLANRWIPSLTYAIEKNDEFIKLYGYEDLRVDLIKIELVGFDEDEEDEGGDGEDEEDPSSDIPPDEIQFVRIIVPDSLNITETGVIHIAYRDYENTKNLRDMDWEYNYECLGKVYYILLGDLDIDNIQNYDVINVSLTSGDELIGSKNFIAFSGDEGLSFDEYADVEFIFNYGEIGALEFGQGEATDKIIELNIPDELNITEGVIRITYENGTVIFSKSLFELQEDETCEHDGQSYGYWISGNMTDFDYSIFKENEIFTASFTYGDNNSLILKGVREGNSLHRINTPEEIANLFKVTVSEGILINGSENAIIIEATDAANRQSVRINIGGGYFVVYVNGKKVENLGRLVRFDNETELEVFRLSGGRDAAARLFIYLSDLNITDNGLYNIRVTHQSEEGATSARSETELFNQNITLTSNVKVDNVTSEVFTGFGMDPVLLYLDTYYGDINETSGTITVLNSDGEEIFSKDIRSLSKDESGRYYLKYSDFENKNFGDNITVMYGDGNERSGNTTVDVLWKDVTSEDFTPVVKEDTVDDYYGNFVNLNIPDLITNGQIIVTIKFKNNHGTNISNMDVTTDFDSKAIYKFNVADIKANYENGDFGLSLSDLGFYEANGDYDIDVKFTADGTSTLNVTNSTLNVAFSDEILINIDENSRYANSLPFATVKVFEPISAYAELYIDGKLYSHKNFEKGLITFDSSASWTSGNHNAEIKVCDSEFGNVLNSSSVSFETLIQSGDVEVTLNDVFKENENVFVTIDVPKAANVTIQIDNGDKIIYALNAGANSVDLGMLSYGNHTIWISYNTTLDDGNLSFYSNYLSLFVGDDGHWLYLPDPLVLDDDDTIKFNFGEDAEGNISVCIDGELVSNITLVNGVANFTLTDLVFGENKYGEHTYNITYSGDKNHDKLSRTGVFNVTYLFKDDIVSEGYPLKESYSVTIILPEDAAGNVTLTVDGGTDSLELSGGDLLRADSKSITIHFAEVKNGKAIFNLKNLAMGEHILDVTYSGDDKYPKASYSTILNVSYYAVVGDFENGNKIVSLMLPNNATGNLTVYNDNRKSLLYSAAVTGGKASIDLSNVSVGIYDIRAYYDGSDYDVKSFATTFKVMPKVDITQDVVIGDNATIFADLDNSRGHLLILIDGLNPALIEINDEGIVNYTFSTDNFSKGNHTVTFQYIGNSFDSDVFNTLDETTGRYVSVKYYLNMLPLNASITTNSDSDEWLTIDCGNATGTIEVFVDGVKYAVVGIVDGIAKIDISQFKDGNYKFTFKYSGDRMYADFTKDLDVSIVHKYASVIANDLNAVYLAGNRYSVVVFTKDGQLANGVMVTFLLDNMAYGSAVTNANGVASIAISSLPGSYKITSKALGVSATKTLNVKHLISLKKATVKKSAKKLVITATLAKVNGKYIKGKKITFKFNGKKYKVKTNKKGVAKLTIKKPVLKKLKVGKKVTYQATYLKDTVKMSVKVKK